MFIHYHHEYHPLSIMPMLFTAIGVLGLLRLGSQLQQRASQPLIHLRSLNPHLSSTLELATSAGPHGEPLALLPRIASPWVTSSADGMSPESLLAGVSAFAFQGTNAHAVLAAAPDASTGTHAYAAATFVPPSSATRHWIHPLLHPLMGALWTTDGGVTGGPRTLVAECRCEFLSRVSTARGDSG